MATSKDFKEWVEFIQPENYEEVYCLYKAVSEEDEWGAFSCTSESRQEDKMYFIKCDYCDDTLVLASEKARKYFLDYIQKKYVTSGMDIESWYSYQYAISKED